MASSWGSSFFPKSLLRRQHCRVTRTPESPKPRHHPNPSITQTPTSPRSWYLPNPNITQTLGSPKPQDHLHPIVTQISMSPKSRNHPDPKVTQILASPKPQHHPNPNITQIPASPKPQDHPHPGTTQTLKSPGSQSHPNLTVTQTPTSPTPQPQGNRTRGRVWHPRCGAGGYLGGCAPRGAGWHCRMMLRMLCVGRGKCSELSRECRTGSPSHCRPVGAVGTSCGSATPSPRCHEPRTPSRAPLTGFLRVGPGLGDAGG